MGSRKLIRISCLLLLSAHIYSILFVADRNAASVISNTIQLLLAIVLLFASTWASLRSEGVLRWWWGCSAIAAFQWAVGQGQFVYYENVLHRIVPTASPLGPLMFLFVAPLWLGLFLLRKSGSAGPDRVSFFFDFGQVVVAAAAAYLQMFYVPARWPVSEATLVGYVLDIRNISIVAAIWLVYFDETEPEIRRVLRQFGAALSFYTIGEIYYFHFTERGVIQSGRWLDLIWSVPLAIMAYSASTASFVPVSSRSGEEEPPYYSRAVPVILPLLSALLALRLYQHVPVTATIILASTICLYACRLASESRSRRRAMADLRSEQLKFSAVTHAANAAILIHAQGRILYSNPFMQRFTGYSDDELMGMDVIDLVSPNHRNLARQRLEQRARGLEVPAQLELQVLAKNGEARWMELSTTAVQISSGNAVLVVGFDVTDRKLSERKLADAVSILEATLESTADGILVVDRQQRVVTYNARFASMWELPEKLLRQRDDRLLLDAVMHKLRDPQQFQARVQELYADPTAETFDVIELNDGSTFERLSRPQILNREIIGRVWSFRDVTQARRLEEQLRQSQKMEAVGTLAGGIAHDFNNLLTVIIGYGALAQSRVPGNDALRNDLTHICRSAEQAATLTRQLLTFSRKQPLHATVFDLNSAVRGTLDLLKRVIGEDIRLEADLDPSPLRIEADQSQMEQVLLNLAVNARDAMPHGGLLRFATQSTNGYVEVSVSDTGDGIPEHVLPHIFEPFFTTKAMGRGTGLGLATAYASVQQSGGSILVDTEPGKGTTFVVRLPQADARLRDHEPQAAESPGGSATILIVEDEKAVRELCSSVLISRGYKVLQSEDAKTALQLCDQQQTHFDLVLTDVIMPDTSGEELVRLLRKRRPAFKVLFMSGYDRPSTNSARDIAPLLMKPFTPTELLNKVRQVLTSPQKSAFTGNP
jgi:PAS domain S-box-containing protein